MTLSQMNDLSTLGLTVATGVNVVFNNSILVEAGDDDAGMSVVFYGTIYAAWADVQSMPDCPFHVTANIGAYEAAKPVPPSSYRGLVDVATVLSGIATLAGWNFENSGVNVKVWNPYLPGTARDQAYAIAQHANVNIIIDGGVPGTLAIWPKGAARNGAVPLISPDTGMIGYPTYTRQGIVVTTLFNPNINFGQNVQIKSSLSPANGTWNVSSLTHTLDTEVPRGNWFTRFEANALSAGAQVR
jgi:hypothetical protein